MLWAAAHHQYCRSFKGAKTLQEKPCKKRKKNMSCSSHMPVQSANLPGECPL
jgi:hypothetical protein